MDLGHCRGSETCGLAVHSQTCLPCLSESQEVGLSVLALELFKIGVDGRASKAQEVVANGVGTLSETQEVGFAAVQLEFGSGTTLAKSKEIRVGR